MRRLRYDDVDPGATAFVIEEGTVSHGGAPAIFRRVVLGQPAETVLVVDLHRRAFDRDVEPEAERVAAGGDGAVRVVGEMGGLALAGARAEIERIVQPERDCAFLGPSAPPLRGYCGLRSLSGRTSMLPWRAGGILATMRMASFRSVASIR